ncbi:MAG: hypothetical protein CL470_08380 [Acidimicrobiaceae bacterium]|nr:hypothetical protein [Acidimicrobiaceae bacterium]|tara:strand:+ start:768 stop:1217 length:450 start_codon:yes stop_codon:yes gene_type:complete
MSHEIGELYHLKRIHNGEWLCKVINLMSFLYCFSGQKTKERPNGFRVSKVSKMMDNEKRYLFDKTLSQFLISTYIIKKVTIIKMDGESFTYLTPINLILDSLTKDYRSILNDKCIYHIDTILNHPYFKKCKNILDIKKRIPSVKDLNER